MCKIGVVVTVFNLEQYIEFCLNSILQQTYQEIELVVVDDGSTDSSGAICDRVANSDRRIKVIHQERQGPILARLHGVEHISADYVTFVDGDDWLDGNLYQTIMDRQMLKEADMVCFGIFRYRGNNDIYRSSCGFKEGSYQKAAIEKEIIPQLFWNSESCTYGLDPSLCSKIFQKELLQKHLNNVSDLDIHYGEDIAVLYPLFLECNTIIMMDECYYYHRMRKRNVVAPYYQDEQYFEKLYRLYHYMHQTFSCSNYGEILLKQLDYFYMYSVKLGKIKYGDLVFEERYLFPFDKVEKGCRLVLYGAGQVGQTFYRQLEKIHFCEVVCWVDKNYQLYDNKGIQPVESIEKVEYDYILIAVYGRETVAVIRDSLIKTGVDILKIIIP